MAATCRCCVFRSPTLCRLPTVMTPLWFFRYETTRRVELQGLGRRDRRRIAVGVDRHQRGQGSKSMVRSLGPSRLSVSRRSSLSLMNRRSLAGTCTKSAVTLILHCCSTGQRKRDSNASGPSPGRYRWTLRVRFVPLPARTAAVLHAPTPSAETVQLGALLLGTFPLDPSRRHVATGPMCTYLIEQAASAYADVVGSLS